MQYWGRLKKFIEADRRALDEGLSPTVRREVKRRKADSKKGDSNKPSGLTQAEWEELKELEAKQ